MVEGIENHYNVSGITHEISALLEDGYVLTGQDLQELATKYGFPSAAFIRDHLGRGLGTYQEGQGAEKTWASPKREILYLMGETLVKEVRYKGRRLLLNAKLPLEETEWKETIEQINKLYADAGRKAKTTPRWGR